MNGGVVEAVQYAACLSPEMGAGDLVPGLKPIPGQLLMHPP